MDTGWYGADRNSHFPPDIPPGSQVSPELQEKLISAYKYCVSSHAQYDQPIGSEEDIRLALREFLSSKHCRLSDEGFDELDGEHQLERDYLESIYGAIEADYANQCHQFLYRNGCLTEGNLAEIRRDRKGLRLSDEVLGQLVSVCERRYRTEAVEPYTQLVNDCLAQEQSLEQSPTLEQFRAEHRLGADAVKAIEQECQQSYRDRTLEYTKRIGAAYAVTVLLTATPSAIQKRLKREQGALGLPDSVVMALIGQAQATLWQEVHAIEAVPPEETIPSDLYTYPVDGLKKVVASRSQAREKYARKCCEIYAKTGTFSDLSDRDKSKLAHLARGLLTREERDEIKRNTESQAAANPLAVAVAVDPLDDFRATLASLQNTLFRHRQKALYTSMVVASFLLLTAGVKAVNDAAPKSDDYREAFDRREIIDPLSWVALLTATTAYYDRHMETQLAAEPAEPATAAPEEILPTPVPQPTTPTTRAPAPARSASSPAPTPARLSPPSSPAPPAPPPSSPTSSGSPAQQSPVDPLGSPADPL